VTECSLDGEKGDRLALRYPCRTPRSGHSRSRVEIGWAVFPAAAAAALLIAALTVGSQTWRAARANPVDSLRYE